MGFLRPKPYIPLILGLFVGSLDKGKYNGAFQEFDEKKG